MSYFGENNRVACSINPERSKVNGLYVPKYQKEMVNDQIAHQYITIPSSTSPAFGSMCTLELKLSGVVLHDISLLLNLSPCTGTSSGNPTLCNGYSMIDRVEFLLSGQTFFISTGLEQLILHNIFENDAVRTNRNYAAGAYNSITNRANYFQNGGQYVLHLKNVLDSIRHVLINDSHSVEIKIYFQSLQNCYIPSGATGTLSCSMNSSSILARVSRLDLASLQYKTSEITKFPYQTLF